MMPLSLTNEKQLARAWVNFDGTLSGTITPREAFNVASITKVGTGNFRVNFLAPMANANYSIAANVNYRGSGGAANSGEYVILHSDGAGATYAAPTVSSFTIGPSNHAGGACDCEFVNAVVFGR